MINQENEEIDIFGKKEKKIDEELKTTKFTDFFKKPI